MESIKDKPLIRNVFQQIWEKKGDLKLLKKLIKKNLIFFAKVIDITEFYPYYI
jgi:hypothetical protein